MRRTSKSSQLAGRLAGVPEIGTSLSLSYFVQGASCEKLHLLRSYRHCLRLGAENHIGLVHVARRQRAQPDVVDILEESNTALFRYALLTIRWRIKRLIISCSMARFRKGCVESSQFCGVADDGVGGLGDVELDLHPPAEGEGCEVGLQPQVIFDGPDGLGQPRKSLLRHRHLDCRGPLGLSWGFLSLCNLREYPLSLQHFKRGRNRLEICG